MGGWDNYEPLSQIQLRKENKYQLRLLSLRKFRYAPNAGIFVSKCGFPIIIKPNLDLVIATVNCCSDCKNPTLPSLFDLTVERII